jgi:hypothetical protein
MDEPARYPRGNNDGEGGEMITRRDFIKGMGALALIPFIPEMVRPERKILLHAGNSDRYDRYVRAYYTVTSNADTTTMTIKTSKDGINWDNTGTMTIPTKEGRLKYRYTVHPDSTDTEIVEE